MINNYSQVFEEWIKVADNDFNAATLLLEDKDEFYAATCYHFQQAGEKYLKAFIIKNKLEFEKTHSLIKLLNICVKKEKDFSELKEEAAFLTMYYTDTKYPTQWGLGITEEDAEKAKESAKRIGEFVKKKII